MKAEQYLLFDQLQKTKKATDENQWLFALRIKGNPKDMANPQKICHINSENKHLYIL